MHGRVSEPEPVEDGAAPREVRRDVGDAHAMAIRTHNTVATLAASLREVLQRQERLERGLNLNSFVAYVIFTVLLASGFFLLYRSRAERLVVERDQAMQQREVAAKETAHLKDKLKAREEAERKGRAFWQLIVDGKKAEAIAAYPEIAKEPLSPVEAQVFQDSVARARAEIVDAAQAEGLEAFRAQQWKRASTAFRRALSYQDEGPRAAQARYYHGVSLHKQGDYAEGARQLDLAVAGSVERTVGQDARYYLASALEMLRQLERARAEYEKFAATYPAHPLSGTARRKVMELAARMPRPQ
ncbi:MAG: tetratricopeptide repeat protein [Deltaproteobacteria bacterium]|nr:tetratricopeptide repeat protein [Deltaproteobacteria bacterium]